MMDSDAQQITAMKNRLMERFATALEKKLEDHPHVKEMTVRGLKWAANAL